MIDMLRTPYMNSANSEFMCYHTHITRCDARSIMVASRRAHRSQQIQHTLAMLHLCDHYQIDTHAYALFIPQPARPCVSVFKTPYTWIATIVPSPFQPFHHTHRLPLRPRCDRWHLGNVPANKIASVYRRSDPRPSRSSGSCT